MKEQKDIQRNRYDDADLQDQSYPAALFSGLSVTSTFRHIFSLDSLAAEQISLYYT